MIIAFDYSMSCPCMCISLRPGWDAARFWYLTTVQKYGVTLFDGRITGAVHKDYKTDQERYDNISQTFIDVLSSYSVPRSVLVYIEDYSFGSKGRVFEIAENTAILKQKLWDKGYDIMTVPPTVIKKFATKSGAAKKEDMHKAFVNKTGFNLHENLTPDKKLGSPVTDIVDAFYIAEYGHNMTKDMI